MNKITITLDAPKLRNLVKNREYQNNNGETVTVQEVKFELVPVKEPKTVFSTEKYDLVKTHFAAALQTKEERESGAETVFVGEGIETVWKNDESGFKHTPIDPNDQFDGLPF